MEIKRAEFVISATAPSQYPQDSMPELVLLGRSNVGKSSFINVVANNRKLAFVGSRPGKTRTINFYKLNNSFYLVDLPGYGYARVPIQEKRRWSEIIETYLKSRINKIAGAFMLLDIRHDPSEDDQLMWQWLQHYNISTGFIAMKADKMRKNQIMSRLDAIRQDMRLPNDIVIVPFSSLTGKGRLEALMAIEEALGGGDGVKI